MKTNANVPTAEFLYGVTAGTPVAAQAATAAQGEPGVDGYVPAKGAKLAVMAGITPTAVKIYSGTDTDATKNELAFSSADAATLESAKAETDTAVFVTPSDTSDEQFVKKTLTVDLSGVTFTEPGVYRYVITETGTNQGITNGYEGEGETTVTKRTLDVYVENDTNASGKNLKIAGYVMYKNEVTEGPYAQNTETVTAVPNGAEVEGALKSKSITNKYDTQDIYFGKEVEGNQGSKDKYFDFTLVLDHVTPGTVFDVDLTNAKTTIPANPNTATTVEALKGENAYTQVSSITVGGTPTGYTVEDSATVGFKKVTVHYYLQDGDYITVKGLAKDMTYNLTENAEDYDSAVHTDKVWKEAVGEVGNDGYVPAQTYNDDAAGTIISADIHTGFTNTREGTIPTGIILSIAGPAIAGIAVVGGIIYFTVRRRKEDAED